MSTRKPSAARLSDKQLAFVGEYMLDMNATQAAIRAGYAEGSADVQGSRLLANESVRSEIDRRLYRRGQRLEISAERVILEYARIAFAKGDDAVSFGPGGVSLKKSSELSEDVLATISAVSETTGKSNEISIKYHDKLAALNFLQKHLGLTREKVEVTGPSGGAVEVAVRQTLDSKLDELGKRLGGGK